MAHSNVRSNSPAEASKKRPASTTDDPEGAINNSKRQRVLEHPQTLSVQRLDVFSPVANPTKLGGIALRQEPEGYVHIAFASDDPGLPEYMGRLTTLFSPKSPKWPDAVALREDDISEKVPVAQMPSEEVRWEGSCPKLATQQILLKREGKCYLVDLTEADKIICKRNATRSRSFMTTMTVMCLKKDCSFPHDSYIRLNKRMLIPNAPIQTETWVFPIIEDDGVEG